MLNLVQTNTNATEPTNETAETDTVNLDELCRLAAQQMLATALLAERQAYLDTHTNQTDATGKRLVVGNGYHQQRDVVTGAGPVTVQAPRVNDKRAEEKFSSRILPAYMRRSPKVTEVLPILYLRGLSTGDFRPALGQFLGTDAGLSASTIQRLTEAWQTEHTDWTERDLSDRDYVYWWADGIHFNVRLEADRLCCLVIVGVRPDGSKELVALADGYREDTESWLDLLRSLKQRGLNGPALATGDGALGFWGALREVFPATVEQRCWVHVTANVLGALLKRLQADAKTAIQKIYGADTRADAIIAVQAFAEEFAEYPKAVKKITGKLDTLLAFYDFPAEHWTHLRTTNPIESTFSTVRLRTRVTRGAGSRRAALAMAYKLLDAAHDRWRKINAPHLVPLVRAGAVFIDGQPQERTTNPTDIDTSQEDVAA
ncbi:TPA: IS256 family transposase [Candidatus Bipolaricaulota bacterium]|nr:IS256 family transposase [Candidatus Bipolaricaulota bacterium]